MTTTQLQLQRAADRIRSWEHEHFCPVVVHGQPCGEWTCFACGEGENEYYLECDRHFMWWVLDPREEVAQ